MTNQEAVKKATELWGEKFDIRISCGSYEGKYYEEYEIYESNPFDEGDEIIGSGKTWEEAFEKAIEHLKPKPEQFGPHAPISVYLAAQREIGRKLAKAFFYAGNQIAGNQIKEDTVIDLGSRYNNPTK